MLILDGQLPDGEGLDLYGELRRASTTRILPVLLLSVSDDVYQSARVASVTDPHLHVGLKPMPLDDIQDIVARLVGA
jgi:CheY-like chemotaxis protein